MHRFWEVEGCQEEEKPLTTEEAKAEEIFDKEVVRTKNGRYTVTLPFKSLSPILW